MYILHDSIHPRADALQIGGRDHGRARELIDDGAVELNLIGQDTTSYGKDIGYEPGLSGLLREMNTLDGVEWIRLMYAYPSDFADEMIDAIADCEKVAKYIDIPLQHINDRVLKAMYRRVTRKETDILLEKCAAGFRAWRFVRRSFPAFRAKPRRSTRNSANSFAISASTRWASSPIQANPARQAATHEGSIASDVIQSRVDELMQVQQEATFANGGRRQRSFAACDDRRFRQGRHLLARHQGQAPDVDSVVHVHGGEHDPGAFVTVRVTGSDGYDLKRPAGCDWASSRGLSAALSRGESPGISDAIVEALAGGIAFSLKLRNFLSDHLRNVFRRHQGRPWKNQRASSIVH